MADALSLTPNTSGVLSVTVEEGGVLRDDATVTATVYPPQGRAALATNVAMPATGGGTGIYTLAVDADWSVSAGKYIEGEYIADVLAVRGLLQAMSRIRYTVRFTDDD